ncbi:MAG: hypothetical protein K1X50_14895 [Candidatus Promineofilum sp.]|nr:hypothetical protein [Promineifilum sp.]MCW5864452.1 hypothetical protein [Anaerolineae bacterium]
MAKKTNRPKAKSTAKPTKSAVTPVNSDIESAPLDTTPAAPAAPAAPRTPRAPKISRSQAAAERLEDEYAYITGDLRRVFILAALMFALLIVANLVFTMIG